MTIRKTLFILSQILLSATIAAGCADTGEIDLSTKFSSDSVSVSPSTSASEASDVPTSRDRSESTGISVSDDSAIYYISDSDPYSDNTSVMNGGQPPVEPENSPFDYTTEDEKITITGLSADFSGELVIPATINGSLVYAVAENAFKDNTAITSLTVEDGVKIVGNGAFSGCKNLKTAIFPKSLEKMGYGALSGCTSLESLTIPFTGAEPKTGKTLKDYNFGYIFGKTRYDNGTKITQYYHEESFLYVNYADYYLPTSLKTVCVTGSEKASYLPYDAFRSCKTLDNVVIGGLIKKIGPFAFSCCTANISFEDPTIESLDEDAFADYKGTSLTIPDGVKYIGVRAVSGCENLSALTIPDSVEKIDFFAFAYSHALKSVTFGDGVQSIGMCAFYFCPKLKTINFGNDLTEIEECAFSACSALETVTLPASLEKLGYDVFEKCRSLKTVTFSDPESWYVYNRTASGIDLDEAALSKPSTAAKYLKTTYYDYRWAKR